MKTISEQLYEVINKFEEEINRNDKRCTLIFRFKDGKFKKFEKSFSMNDEDVGIEITD